jgi:hypothetical protein
VVWQLVTAADALALAEALERMLPFLPNEDVVAGGVRLLTVVTHFRRPCKSRDLTSS